MFKNRYLYLVIFLQRRRTERCHSQKRWYVRFVRAAHFQTSVCGVRICRTGYYVSTRVDDSVRAVTDGSRWRRRYQRIRIVRRIHNGKRLLLLLLLWLCLCLRLLCARLLLTRLTTRLSRIGLRLWLLLWRGRLLLRLSTDLRGLLLLLLLLLHHTATGSRWLDSLQTVRSISHFLG